MSNMNQIFALQQSAQELRDQIRTSVQDQIRAAQGGGQNGRQVVVQTPDGKTVTVSPETQEFLRGLDVPPRAEGIAYAFLFTIAAMVIFTPIARALGRRIDRKSEQPQIPAQVTAQLTQITQAVDSIAIEVERISEGQRFTTKLLSEQQKGTRALPSS